MTGREVFDAACRILHEEPGADKYFLSSALSLINLLIAEALPYQNNRERADGRAETAAFSIKALDDEITLDAPLVSLALPYGLASYFYQDENDNFLSQEYRGRYLVALNDAKKAETLDITDEYATESEE